MDATTALKLLRTSAPLEVVSDRGLESRVHAAAPNASTLRHAPLLHGHRDVVLADTLRLLSIATAPLYSGSLLGAYMEWAQLRYIGAFDVGTPQVELSRAAKDVAGNQRRVQSEELGIAFAVHVGLDYLTRGAGWVGSVTDVDVALTTGSIKAARQRFAVSLQTGQRPDYILQAYHPATRQHRLMLLECKGTKSRSHSIRQLAQASSQLSGLTVEHDLPPGLAVSSVLSDGKTWVNVLRTAQGRTRHYWTKRQPTPLTVGLHDDSLREHPELILDDRQEVSATDLARVATRDGWAALALYAGNEDGFQQWAASAARLKRQFETQPSDRSTSTATLPSGEIALGERMTLQTPFGAVSSFRGLVSSVFEALSGSDPGHVVAAQRDSALTSLTFDDLDGHQVISQGRDGSVLILNFG